MECDMQGIVNNGVYLNYYEHARHEFLQSNNMSFKAITDSKIFLVLIRSEIDYLHSLASNDDFFVTVAYQKISRLKLLFSQEIYLNNKDSQKRILASTAKFTVVALDNNRKPIRFPTRF